MKILPRYLLNELPNYLDLILAETSDKSLQNLFIETISQNESINLSSEKIEQLTIFLSKIFMLKGLQEDSEPNEFGLFLDSVIGELNKIDRVK